ncbi:phospholipase [Sulfurifustis variabilis]|uniref:Phospholipase n=1 Tax=Sulfurifustis variabilis TaxID=1675686 RepID=A0A1B4V912_9GAMM|nr:phosphatidylserine/phosphatidylglycerophosphate/cardiolipin synthase family protein [Sulfurifustis variabilis]BAU47944.1 phospholipase [Sulfurifustis variabilis]
MNRGKAITVLLLGFGVALAWASCRQPADPAASRDARPPELAHFGPYDAGMNLREAYESLPRGGGERIGLRLIVPNMEAWSARWRLLEQARETLDISYFIVREDFFGAAFLGHLLAKARQGVRIRLLLDAQGSSMAGLSPRGNDWLDALANTGNVAIKLYRPLANRYLEALFTLNPVAAVASEHDKIVVVDGRRGMIGGRNISAEYFAHPSDMKDAFEDTDLILTGRSIADALTQAFESQYDSAGARKLPAERVDLADFADELTLAYRTMDAWIKGRPLDEFVQAATERKLAWPDEMKRYARLRGTYAAREPPDTVAETRILDSRTRLEARGDVIGEGLARLVQSASREILVQSPYLVLSEGAVATLEAAGRRGVRITIITNSPISSDNALSQAFFLEQWPELLARVPGLRIFVAGRPRNIHSKVAVFDDEVALVGTYNLDPVSMAVNSEIMAAVWSRAFARLAAAHPREQIAEGPPGLYEYRIERTASGQPVRGKDGRPVVAFGPKDHTSPSDWRKVQAYWAMLRAAEKLPGLAPLF